MGIMRTLTINGVTYDVAPVVPSSNVTLLANAWVGEEDSYYQIVELSGVTEHTMVDLQPTSEQLVEFHNKVLGFVAENEGGVVTVFAIGDKPTGDHTIQVTLTEVERTGKIRGNTVGTTMPRSNLDQTDPRKADYVKGRERITSLEEQVADIIAELNYEDIAITAFACPGAGTYEMGQSVAAPTITWELNKEPASQSLNGETLDVTARSMPYTGNLTSNKTYTLTVTGQKGEKAKQSGTFTFLNGVYYGVCNDGDEPEAIMAGLSKKLQNSSGLTFTATAGSGQRHAYAIPSRYGKPTFTDAETKLSAGMYLAEEDFDFTNGCGYTEKYNLWLSARPALGEMTIVVS